MFILLKVKMIIKSNYMAIIIHMFVGCFVEMVAL